MCHVQNIFLVFLSFWMNWVVGMVLLLPVVSSFPVCVDDLLFATPVAVVDVGVVEVICSCISSDRSNERPCVDLHVQGHRCMRFWYSPTEILVCPARTF